MNPDALSAALLAVIAPLVEARRAGASDGLTAADFPVERPKNRDHGDWASNAALKLSKQVGANPRELAAEIAAALGAADGIASVEVAGPGFINIRLDAAAAGALAKTIVEAGAAFGSNRSQDGNSINLEFVSANPTGPMHIGHTRWAALGDAIARLLLASGATLVREFYINDAGAQMERFGRSVLAAIKGEPTPEDGYPGAYIDDLAARVKAVEPGILDLPEDEQVTVARDRGYEFQLGDLQASLVKFNVHFDVWFSERTLHAAGEDGAPSLVDKRAPSGCERPTSATTKTASSVARTANTPTSPPTPRTT
jgi:arginyl-tRNA synthetase